MCTKVAREAGGLTAGEVSRWVTGCMRAPPYTGWGAIAAAAPGCFTDAATPAVDPLAASSAACLPAEPHAGVPLTYPAPSEQYCPRFMLVGAAPAPSPLPSPSCSYDFNHLRHRASTPRCWCCALSLEQCAGSLTAAPTPPPHRRLPWHSTHPPACPTACPPSHPPAQLPCSNSGRSRTKGSTASVIN